MKNNIVMIILIVVAVVFVALSIFNFASPKKSYAQENYDDYFDEYLDCQMLWSDCLDKSHFDNHFKDLAEQAKDLMDEWSRRMDLQKSIIQGYNTRGIIFGVLALLSVGGAVVVKKKTDNPSKAPAEVSE